MPSRQPRAFRAYFALPLTVLVLAVVAVCVAQAPHEHGPVTAPAVKSAIAVIHPLGESKVKGIVRFTEMAGGVKVTGDIEGLTPNGKHAFHIHEFGDCSAADGMSAGGHYNPEGKPHGAPDAKEHHAGDMGNLEANADGKAHVEVMLEGASVMGYHAPIVGRGVIIHAKADDFSQPVGNAGGRIACSVIGIAKPQ